MQPRSTFSINSFLSSNSNRHSLSPRFQLCALLAASAIFIGFMQAVDAWGQGTPAPILSVPILVHGTNYLFETLESYLASCMSSAVLSGYGDVLHTNESLDYVLFHDNGDDKLFRDSAKEVQEVFQNYLIQLYDKCLSKFKSNENKIAGITLGAAFGGILLIAAAVVIPLCISWRRHLNRHANNAHLAELPVFRPVAPAVLVDPPAAPAVPVDPPVAPPAKELTDTVEKPASEKDLEKQSPVEELDPFPSGPGLNK